MRKILFAFLSVLLFNSCSKTRVNCDFQGGVILSKYNPFPNDKVTYDIQFKGEIYCHVTPYDIDAFYNVGDTINKPCLEN